MLLHVRLTGLQQDLLTTDELMTDELMWKTICYLLVQCTIIIFHLSPLLHNLNAKVKQRLRLRLHGAAVGASFPVLPRLNCFALAGTFSTCSPALRDGSH